MKDVLGLFETGPAHERDLDDVVRLIDAADQALGVPLHPVRDELSWAWHLPTTDLERDTTVVRDRHEVVGYGEALWKHPDDGGPLELLARVHPDRRGAGIGTWLLSWGEAVARKRGTQGIRAWTEDRDALGHSLLQSRGYVHVRSSFTMARDLDPEEDAGTAPAGVVIRRYDDADERALFDVYQASFADGWDFRPTSFESFNGELHAEGWDPSLVFLAGANGKTVGHVASFLYETCGYVAILGVLKDWRGRGIATALLRRSFAELVSRGMPEVRLGVDARNPTGAVALYEAVGMSVHRRYDIFELGAEQGASVQATARLGPDDGEEA